MDKLLTITIPTYNTEQYLPRCIESLIVPEFMDRLEILVVIDGSPDHSEEVARRYEAQYPGSIRVVSKANGGHGSTINKGIELATGMYFRVLDSDDWFDTAEFEKFLRKLEKTNADMVLTPSTREYTYENRTEVLDFEGLSYDTVYDASTFDYSDFVGDKLNTMARTTYKTSILRKSKLELPEHMFYVDVLYSFCVIPFVRDFTVFNLNIYRYFIGRPEQSVNNYEKHIGNLRIVTCLCLQFLRQHPNISANKSDYLIKEVKVRVRQFAHLSYLRIPAKQTIPNLAMIRQEINSLQEKDKPYFTEELRHFKLYSLFPALYVFSLKVWLKTRKAFK